MESNWVLILLYLKNVLYWSEDDRLRSKHVAVMWPDSIYYITILIYCCVLTGYNTLYKFVNTQPDGLCQKSRRMRWEGHVARMGERTDIYRVYVGKRDWKRPLVRPRCRWEDNIKMDLQEAECEGMDWIELAQDRLRALVNAVMNLRFP